MGRVTKVETFLAGQGPASRALYSVVRAFVAGFTRLWTRTGIEGREHIPKTGAFVLAPIHRSNIDTPIASCLTRRRMRFMGKDSLWKGRAWSWFLSSLGGFPVSPGALPTGRRCSAASPCSRRGSRSCCSPRASASPARPCSRCSTAPPTSP